MVFIYDGSGDPKENLDKAVSEYTKGNKYFSEFIDAHLNMPYVRMVVEDVNDMDQYDIKMDKL